MNVEKIMADLEAKHPGESEYLQAVREVLESIEEVYNQHPEFEKSLRRLRSLSAWLSPSASSLSV